jgi:hypothetical protein
VVSFLAKNIYTTSWIPSIHIYFSWNTENTLSSH